MQQALFEESKETAQKNATKKKSLSPLVLPVPSTGKIGPYSLNTVCPVDCVEGMKNLPPHSVDIAIADPPYNVSKGGNWKWDNSVKLAGFGGDWSKVMAGWDNVPMADYFAFTLTWLAELKRVVRPTGSLWIHGTYHNIGIINFALQLLEIEIINEVVWYKRNSFPNLSGRRLTASHETILWAHTGKKRAYYFDYETAKAMECLEDGLKTAGKQMRTVWDIPNNKESSELEHGKHPTQKPLRLLARMLALTAQPGQICLAPFAGGGSECLAAKRSGLNFIGFEIEPEYLSLCNRRLGLPDNSEEAPVSEVESETVKEAIAPYTVPAKKSSPKKAEIKVPSLIKWTGTKRSQAAAIASYAPEHKRYIEPFVGSGAELFLMAKAGAIAADIYAPLIALWRLVQDEPAELAENYRQQWDALHQDLPGYFYTVRERFNASPNPADLNFLLRTCVNGIVRFNDAGQFNNSFHLSRPGMNPERYRDIVYQWHHRLQGVDIRCQDYAETLAEAQTGDFVYLDPPYLGSKQRYIQNIEIERFLCSLDVLNRRNIRWALSFDGRRGGVDLCEPLPKELYKRRLLLKSGNSTVGKVLNGSVEMVEESLYLNY